MSKQIDALKLALEALKKARRKILTTEECHAVIMSIKEALRSSPNGEAQLAVALEQRNNEHLEPVAWMYESVCGNDFATRHKPPDYGKNIRPLYTTPPQRTWVGLTDEEILSWWSMDNDLEDLDMCNIVHFRKVIEEVQAKLKRKNT